MDHSLSGTEEKPGVRLLSWGINWIGYLKYI